MEVKEKTLKEQELGVQRAGHSYVKEPGVYIFLVCQRGGETFSTFRETFWIFVDFNLILTHLCRNFFVPPLHFFYNFHYFFHISSYFFLKASISIGKHEKIPQNVYALSHLGKLLVNFYAYLGEIFLEIRKIYTPAFCFFLAIFWDKTCTKTDFFPGGFWRR